MCDKDGLLCAADRAGRRVLLQHPPCNPVACCIWKKAERGLCCFKCKVDVCPSSLGGAQGRKASCTGSDAH